jgi:hypothetical protein
MTDSSIQVDTGEPVFCQDILPELPMTEPHRLTKFYVRECYDAYYQLVLCLMQGEDVKVTLDGPNNNVMKLEKLNTISEYKFDCITVTGTPGIGKSMFYQYFFQRFRQEHPGQTIVTAAFSRGRILKQCREFRGNSMQWIEHSTIPKSPGALYLYDGPPEIAPARQKMVCFTSPDFDWLNSMRTDAAHESIRMPVWTLEELELARDTLKLDYLSSEMLEDRYEFFGGSARYCLEEHFHIVSLEKSQLLDGTKEIDSFDQMVSLLTLDTPKPTLAHAIFHFKPEVLTESHRPVFYLMFFCSKQIAEKVFTNIKDHSEQKRGGFLDWLSHRWDIDTFRGWLFEYLAHEDLKIEKDFDLKAMNSTYTDLVLRIPNGHYVMPKYRNIAAVDAHYLDNAHSRLFLFQMSLNENHPVTAYGLANYIKREVGFTLEQASHLEICLVFVIPTEILDVFSEQKIESETCPADTDSVQRLRGLDARSVKMLELQNIRTVQDFVLGFETGVLKCSVAYRRPYENLCEMKTHAPEYERLEHLSQFKLGVPF